MFDVKVSASTPAELTAAIVALAAAMQAAPAVPQQATPAPTVNHAVAAPIASAPLPMPTPPPVAVAPAVPPVANSPAPVTPPPVVPVAAAPVFTCEQIMAAGAALIDAGKMNELMTLLNSFGIQAVTQLKEEQLGGFATELRKLGAQI